MLLFYDYVSVRNTYISASLLLLLLEALQLQRSFGLLDGFFPFGSVSDAVLPVGYPHVGKVK